VNQTDEFLNQLLHEAAVWVRVDSIQGSVPRGPGAWMAVFRNSVVGTIGGGHVEFQAIDLARERLKGATGEMVLRFALGPSLGQCCGGVVHLRFEVMCAGDIPQARAWLLAQRQQTWQPVALFGGGHVGRALIGILGTLPFSVTWVDSRDEIFPSSLPGNVVCEHSDPVHRAVSDLPPRSSVLIMSFSHAEDLDVVAACLTRQRLRGDLPYIGLIGSQTKWATFQHRLTGRGFSASEMAKVTCPIGVAGISGKEPEVIAVAVAAQLLQCRG
jgi:xanthine dehydrogenase accessory factor